jgi:hypothetical protein
MSFNNFPGFKPGKKKPLVGPQSNPNMPMPEFQMDGGQGQARFNQTSNANAADWKQPKSKPSGRRIGKKAKRPKKDPNEPSIGYPVFVGNRDFSDNNNIKLVSSDFGYNIDGSPSPNDFEDCRDQTLFRDYNVRSQISEEEGNFFSAVTNQVKTLEINPALANASPGYQSQFFVIQDLIYRGVCDTSRNQKGALDALNDLPKYLDVMSQAFATLIQLESVQSWNPSDNAYYDRSLRYLASKMSGTELLELRTQLRQVLIPHVLPVEWMKYIKWIYSVHLRNHAPESTKLRFLDVRTVGLIDKILLATTAEPVITEYTDHVTGLITDIRNLNQVIPSVLINNASNVVNFANCKDWYDGMHNSADYDAEWLNLFNNRMICYEDAGPATGQVSHYPSLSSNFYLCLDSTTPYSMVLAQSSRQASSKNPGLPLEGPSSVKTIGTSANKYNRFVFVESITGDITFEPVITLTQDNTDSIHRMDFTETSGSTTPNNYYSMPAGIQSLAIFGSRANCEMAARESLSKMTLK